MGLQQWFDGIYLIGRFNWFQTGCWLLAHGSEAAVLEMPPWGMREVCPADAVQEAAAELGVAAVKYLLCTHAHLDHYSGRTYRRMRDAFPHAEPCLHEGFRGGSGLDRGVRYFGEELQLDLAGEALFLVHAPKHSRTDTMVIFRGAACTGDWELGTIRSVHDWTRVWAVPDAQKQESISRMERFPTDYHYHVHRIFSVHANDRREGIDFPGLMASTREDRPLG